MGRIPSLPIVATAALLSLALATPVAAQQADGAAHAVSGEEIDRALAERAERHAADRAAIQRLLDRTEVRNLAATLGVEVERVEAAAATLDGAELARAASLARGAEAALVGGDTIVISTTALIIALLVLIVLLVA